MSVSVSLLCFRCPRLQCGAAAFPEGLVQVLHPLLRRSARHGGGPLQLLRHLPRRLLQRLLQGGAGLSTAAQKRANAVARDGCCPALLRRGLRVPAQPAVGVRRAGCPGHHDPLVGADDRAAGRRQAAGGCLLGPGAGPQHCCVPGHEAKMVLLLMPVRVPAGPAHVPHLRAAAAARGHLEKDQIP